MAGDARALLAQGFLGDLNDDFLAGRQHFGNQLGTALLLLMTVVLMTRAVTVMAVSAATLWPLEAGAVWFGDARAHGTRLRRLHCVLLREVGGLFGTAFWATLGYSLFHAFAGGFDDRGVFAFASFGFGGELFGLRCTLGSLGVFFVEDAMLVFGGVDLGARFVLPRFGDLFGERTCFFVGEVRVLRGGFEYLGGSFTREDLRLRLRNVSVYLVFRFFRFDLRRIHFCRGFKGRRRERTGGSPLRFVGLGWCLVRCFRGAGVQRRRQSRRRGALGCRVFGRSFRRRGWLRARNAVFVLCERFAGQNDRFEVGRKLFRGLLVGPGRERPRRRVFRRRQIAAMAWTAIVTPSTAPASATATTAVATSVAATIAATIVTAIASLALAETVRAATLLSVPLLTVFLLSVRSGPTRERLALLRGRLLDSAYSAAAQDPHAAAAGVSGADESEREAGSWAGEASAPGSAESCAGVSADAGRANTEPPCCSIF